MHRSILTLAGFVLLAAQAASQGQPAAGAQAPQISTTKVDGTDKERLEVLKDPNTVLPDETVDARRTITLGGTALELTYVGPNHSDSTLVMRLPKERIVFVVDVLPVGQMPGRGLIDFYPLEAEAAIRRILAMDWDRLIPGHPGAGGRLGTKKDAQDQLTFLQDASAAVKAEAQQGRCWEPVESQLKRPKHA